MVIHQQTKLGKRGLTLKVDLCDCNYLASSSSDKSKIFIDEISANRIFFSRINNRAF